MPRASVEPFTKSHAFLPPTRGAVQLRLQIVQRPEPAQRFGACRVGIETVTHKVRDAQLDVPLELFTHVATQQIVPPHTETKRAADAGAEHQTLSEAASRIDATAVAYCFQRTDSLRRCARPDAVSL